MPSVLIDTHILIWWRSDPPRLSPRQAHILKDLEAQGRPASISAVSLRELALLGSRGRLEISAPWDLWLEELADHPMFDILPLTPRIAAESVRLGPDFPKDPADQIIAATARCHGLPLLTADAHIRRWGGVRII